MNSLGILGEKAACRYLRRKRYRILETNFARRFGEIDIIAVKGKYIAFVEVKQRSSNGISTPGEAVDFRKQQKIIKTAKAYIAENPSDKMFRFDVIEVICDNDKIKSVNHIKNAFYEDGF